MTIRQVLDAASQTTDQPQLVSLANRIRARAAHVAVMGLGYAGLPMAVEFARAGFEVTGIDIDRSRVDAVNQGRSPVSDVASETLASLVGQARLSATSQLEVLSSADCVLICVPTPLTEDRRPDMRFVRAAAQSIAAHVHPGMLIVLQSTCSPGTTRRIVLPIFQEVSSLVAGQDYWLVFAPERIDPGNPNFTVFNTPKVIGGLSPAATDLAASLFEPLVQRIVRVSSPEVAELTKLLENAFRFVNISFINEIAQLCDSMGIDVSEVVAAAATKPFGFLAHYPGPGVGGHCIPIVPFFLEDAARQYGIQGELIAAAGRVNDAMPDVVVGKLEHRLAEIGQRLAGARVLLLGAAYKPDTNDVRESAIFPVWQRLVACGADVAYYDPLVPSLVVDGREHRSLEPSELLSQDFAAALVLTRHSSTPHVGIAGRVAVFLDTSAGAPRQQGRPAVVASITPPAPEASAERRALVTGGAGFIGSHLIEALLDRRWSVSVIDDCSTGRVDNIQHLLDHQRLRFVHGSITDRHKLEPLVAESDVVFHLAAALGVQRIVESPLECMETNVFGTHAVLELAARHRRKLLLASTSEVYGKSSKPAFHEEDDRILGATSKARWSYAGSKAMDEFLTLAYHAERGLPAVIFRLFNTVGPRQTGRYGMVVPRFVDQALQGQRLTIYGDGLQSRCFCDVADVVPAIIGLAENEQAIGGIFNIGSTREVTILDLARTVLRLVGQWSGTDPGVDEQRLEFVPYAQAYAAGFEDMRRRMPDTTRIQQLLNWQPQLTLEQTLERVIASCAEAMDLRGLVAA
jgi:UDP-N-acetyl-D-glucosamine dehydrogenase